MKSRGLFVGTLLLGNLAMLSALSLHIVRSPDKGLAVVPKSQLTLVDTYVDTRSWTPSDVARHPAFARRVMECGKGDLLGSSSTDECESCTMSQHSASRTVIAPTTQPAAAPHVEADSPSSIFDFGKGK